MRSGYSRYWGPWRSQTSPTSQPWLSSPILLHWSAPTAKVSHGSAALLKSCTWRMIRRVELPWIPGWFSFLFLTFCCPKVSPSSSSPLKTELQQSPTLCCTSGGVCTWAVPETPPRWDDRWCWWCQSVSCDVSVLSLFLSAAWTHPSPSNLYSRDSSRWSSPQGWVPKLTSSPPQVVKLIDLLLFLVRRSRRWTSIPKYSTSAQLPWRPSPWRWRGPASVLWWVRFWLVIVVCV